MDTRVFLTGLLKELQELQAAGLHLKTNCEARIRTKGSLIPVKDSVTSKAQIEEIVNLISNSYHRQILESSKGVDLAFQWEGVGRFRVNIFHDRGELSLVFRLIKDEIPAFESLRIPSVLKTAVMSDRGLVLVSGPTSSGKSTTVAALVDYLNSHREVRIITIEDPIEYLHRDRKGMVSQREIGQDVSSFAAALRYVVRQDPDVIVVGEIRDVETMNSALASSETGHLVISTVHAKNVMQTFERVLGFYPPSEHETLLPRLAFNVVAIACQRLLRRKDAQGLIATFEVMIMNPSIHKLAREGRLDKIQQVMQGSKTEGMQTFNQSLIELFHAGLVTKDEAMETSDNAPALEMNLKGIFLDEAQGGILGTNK